MHEMLTRYEENIPLYTTRLVKNRVRSIEFFFFFLNEKATKSHIMPDDLLGSSTDNFPDLKTGNIGDLKKLPLSSLGVQRNEG